MTFALKLFGKCALLSSSRQERENEREEEKQRDVEVSSIFPPCLKGFLG